MAATRRDRAARIVDAALAIVVEQGWRAVTLEAVAARCDIEADEVYRLAPTPAAILDLFARRIDLAVTGDADAPPPDGTVEETPRDRLFDVLMRRFDALTPHRDAIAVLARALPRDPATVLATLPQARRSFGLMLQAAGIATKGPCDRLRIASLLGLWLAVQHVWLRDDSVDAARTMAALDRHLGRLFVWSPVFRDV